MFVGKTTPLLNHQEYELLEDEDEGDWKESTFDVAKRNFPCVIAGLDCPLEMIYR